MVKASLRQQRKYLTFQDLKHLAKHFHLPSDVLQGNRQKILEGLVDHLDDGWDPTFRTDCLADHEQEANIDCLAEDPLFEAAFENLAEEDREELGEAKKAITKSKCNRIWRNKNLKRKLQGAMGVRPKAKAKTAPAGPAAGPPAPVTPPAAAAGAAAPPEVAAAAELPLRRAAKLGVHYKYVRIPGFGDMVYSTVLKKINAHCLTPHPDIHHNGKCHMDRLQKKPVPVVLVSRLKEGPSVC